MKKLFLVVLALGLVVVMSNTVWAEDCATIKDGEIYASTGELLTTGFDEFGYNYQAHMFNGRYCDQDRVEGGVWCDADFIMKWNDAFLSNKDCDLDGLLDRHYGYDSYKGSGAWLTNHILRKVEVDGKLKKWSYFVKIVAVPSDAYLEGGYWYSGDGIQIGPAIWGDFARIQWIYNDPSYDLDPSEPGLEGVHGIQFRSPVGPGFGIYRPEDE